MTDTLNTPTQVLDTGQRPTPIFVPYVSAGPQTPEADRLLANVLRRLLASDASASCYPGRFTFAGVRLGVSKDEFLALRAVMDDH